MLKIERVKVKIYVIYVINLCNYFYEQEVTEFKRRAIRLKPGFSFCRHAKSRDSLILGCLAHQLSAVKGLKKSWRYPYTNRVKKRIIGRQPLEVKSWGWESYRKAVSSTGTKTAAPQSNLWIKKITITIFFDDKNIYNFRDIDMSNRVISLFARQYPY